MPVSRNRSRTREVVKEVIAMAQRKGADAAAPKDAQIGRKDRRRGLRARSSSTKPRSCGALGCRNIEALPRHMAMKT